MAKAIGMIEFGSIARGIYAADQMVKTSDVEIVTARRGEETAEEFLIDSIVIPNVHPRVFPAIVGTTMPEEIQALGILESYSLATMVIATDAVLKSAELDAIEIRLGTGLGGKAYFTFTGDVAAVKTGVNVGMEIIGDAGVLLNAEVIPSPSKKLIESLY